MLALRRAFVPPSDSDPSRLRVFDSLAEEPDRLGVAARYQPESELSRWYERRFGHGSKRLRKTGMVALARRLLVELWKYLETGTPPAGAKLKEDALRTA